MLMLRDIARRLDEKHLNFTIEAGHKDMGELGSLIKQLSEAGHWEGCTNTFQYKKDLRPLQTADVWAWELRKFGREQILNTGRPLRKSLEVLVGDDPNKRVMVLDDAMLLQWFARHAELMCG
jgi:hypothetical protein